MPTADSLYRAIIDNPRDDAARLIYADYLDDQGDPRGEFIRLQCELAKMSPFDDRWSEYAARERRLLYRYGADWNQSLAQVLRRGFVAGLNQYQPAGIADWGPEVFAEHPIELIWFYYQEEPGWGKAFADCGFLKNLRTIWIGGRSAYLESYDLFDMLASPHLKQLETFCITGDSMEGLDHRTFPELITHGGPLPPGLQNLRALSLNLWCDGPILDDAGFAMLIESNLGSTLTCLSLEGEHALTTEGLGVLAESALWDRLQELDLDYLRDVPDAFVPAWTRSRLQRLSVHTTGDGFSKLFLTASQWGELTHLDLDDTQISLDDFRRFVEHPSFACLKELHINDDRLTDDHIELLASAPQVAGLRALHLRQYYQGEDGLIALSRSPWCNQLCELSLNNVTLEGIKAFVGSENFTRLHTFTFSTDELAACLEVLAKASNLPRLTNLGAYSTTVDLGAEFLPKLLASPHLKRLSYLDVFDPQAPECYEAFRNAEHVVWVGQTCRERYPDLVRKYYLMPQNLAPPTPPFFSWKPLY